MKYYSELLDTVFDTEGACKDAEASYLKDNKKGGKSIAKAESAKAETEKSEAERLTSALSESCNSLREKFKEYCVKREDIGERLKQISDELDKLGEEYSAPFLEYIFREDDASISDEDIAMRCYKIFSSDDLDDILDSNEIYDRLHFALGGIGSDDVGDDSFWGDEDDEEEDWDEDDDFDDDEEEYDPIITDIAVTLELLKGWI